MGDCPIAGEAARLFNRFAKAAGSRHRFASLKLSDEFNYVDAAIARPLSMDMVSAEIMGIGEPAGMVEGTLGMAVQKSGRTTEWTSGTVTQMDMTVQVWYGAGLALFEGQLAGDIESAGGDSGSAVLSMDNRVAGLLFAGGEGITIFNPASAVESALGVTF